METFTIADVVRRWAAGTPQRPAVTYEGATLTWTELRHRSAQVAQALAAEGVGPQERVAFVDKNSPAYLECLFGGAMINAVSVAVSWRLAPPEMSYIINDAEAKVLVIGADFADQLASFEHELTTVKKVVIIGDDHDDDGGHETFERWLRHHEPIDPGVRSGPDDIAMLVYTSGTSGLPKGVMLTNTNLGALVAAAPDLGFTDDSVVMVTLPLFHVAGSGWALLALGNGAHTVLLRDVDPAAILDSLERDRITHTLFVPVILFFLLLTPGVEDRDYKSLQLIVYGTSPITEDLLTQSLATFKCGMAQVYGLTETSGPVALLAPEDHTDGAHPERLRAAGRPWPGVELRVVDGSGRDAPQDEVGEVWVRSAQNMLGYWHKPDETAQTLNEGGWLRTGDAGYLDADGYLYLFDRIKDMIVSGGENVYPVEVENVLSAHPSVGEVAVIGVPSEKWGETVRAVVVLAPGANQSAEELIAFTKSQLAGYKCPTAVDFVESLPRNLTGKVLKRELREPYWAGFERRVN